jgi:hypothetical protein
MGTRDLDRARILVFEDLAMAVFLPIVSILLTGGQASDIAVQTALAALLVAGSSCSHPGTATYSAARSSRVGRGLPPGPLGSCSWSRRRRGRERLGRRRRVPDRHRVPVLRPPGRAD